MRILIIVILAVCIVIQYANNIVLKNKITTIPYYHSNLSREEMGRLLMTACNDTIYLFVPGDTSVMPYLNKANKETIMQGEYARR